MSIHAAPSNRSEPAVGFWYRLRAAASLLTGIRRHEFRSAGRLMQLEFEDQSWLMQRISFIRWSLRRIWITIPNTMPYVTIGSQVSRTPHWLEADNPLINYPWQNTPNARLPQEVDTVVIGAGFTGSSAAYFWSQQAPAGKQLVVLEMNEAASGASGRNQGTIVMGRYFAMVRDTVINYLPGVRSDLTLPQQKRMAEQFADVYCSAAERNADLIEQTIAREHFDVDYHRNGWVQERLSDQQEDLAESVVAGMQWGHTDWTSISPQRVFEESAMRVDHPAGFSRKAGTWHPAKWVWSLLTCAMKQPNVQFFSRTKVLRISYEHGRHMVHTSRGTIRAKHILYGVESYLPVLDKRFDDIVEPHQEQLSSGLGPPQAMPEDNSISGRYFFGARRGNVLLAGTDSTRVPDRLAGCNNPSRLLTKFSLSEYKRVYGPYRFKLTNEWSGTVGYTPDEYPIIGALDDLGQYIIAGMCGSGSGVAFNAARCMVNRILKITDQRDDYPPEYFAPSRLLDPEQHPWPKLNEGKP
jgi:gamma-glutamylputrescine oxidase